MKSVELSLGRGMGMNITARHQVLQPCEHCTLGQKTTYTPRVRERGNSEHCITDWTRPASNLPKVFPEQAPKGL